MSNEKASVAGGFFITIELIGPLGYPYAWVGTISGGVDARLLSRSVERRQNQLLIMRRSKATALLIISRLTST